MSDLPHDRLPGCDSCGDTDPGPLSRVQRVYLSSTAAADPTAVATSDDEEMAKVDPEVERWCLPCRTHYPHVEV